MSINNCELTYSIWRYLRLFDTATPRAILEYPELKAVVHEILQRKLTQGALRVFTGWISTQCGGESSTRVCGKVFAEGDIAYTCKQCQSDQSCVMCVQCFKSSGHAPGGSLHKSHEVKYHRTTAGGCCDCGDSEAWAEEGTCSRHGSKAETSDPAEALPRNIREVLQAVFTAMLCFIRETELEVSASYNLPSSSFSGQARDISIDPLDHSKPLLNIGSSSSLADVAKSTVSEDSWDLIVHNDDIHTYEDVTLAFFSIGKLHDPTFTDAAAKKLTVEVDKVGEAKIATLSPSSNPRHVESLKVIEKSGLFYSLESAKLRKAQGICEKMIEFLGKCAELSSATAKVIADAALSDLHSPLESPLLNASLNVEVGADQDVVIPFHGPFTRGFSGAIKVASANLPDAHQHDPSVARKSLGTSILQDFVRYDAHQTRKIRVLVHVLFTHLVRITEFRTSLGLSFVSAYEETYARYSLGMGVNRSSETIFELCVQLLTVPSIIHTLAGDRLLPESIFNACYFLLASSCNTSSIVQSGKHILDRVNRALFKNVLPDNSQIIGDHVYRGYCPVVNPIAGPLRIPDDDAGHYGHVLSHLQYILRAPGFSNAAIRRCLPTLLQSLALLTRMHPQSRATQAHVEFEDNRWRVSFNLNVTAFISIRPILSGMTIALNRGARSVDSSVDHSESTSLDLEPLSPKECVHVMAEAASHLELWYNRFMIEDRAKRGVVDRGNFTQFRGKYALVRQGRALRTFFNIPDEQLRGLEDVNTYLGTLGPWLEPNVLSTLSTRSYHVPLPRFVAALARQITETTTSVFEVLSNSELVNNPEIYSDILTTILGESNKNVKSLLIKLSNPKNVLFALDAITMAIGSTMKETPLHFGSGILTPRFFSLYLSDLPLQSLILYFEVQSNLWVRNGHSMLEESFNYTYSDSGSVTRDLDLLAVQMGLRLASPQQGFSLIVHRFNLQQWCEYSHLKFESVEARRQFLDSLLLVPSLFSLLSSLVTETPILALQYGGSVSPYDAPFADVEGEFAEIAHKHGANLPPEADTMPGHLLREWDSASSSYAGGDIDHDSQVCLLEAVEEKPASYEDNDLSRDTKRTRIGSTSTIIESSSISSIRLIHDAIDISSSNRLINLRRELVHALSSGPKQYSYLLKITAAIYRFASASDNKSEENLDSMLKLIADYKPPSGPESGTYALRDEIFVTEYDGLFYHLHPKLHTTAKEAWIAKRNLTSPSSKEVGSQPRPYVPCPPPAHPAFVNIRRILHTVGLAKLIKKIFLQSVDSPKSFSVPEASLPSALSVLTLSIHCWPVSRVKSSLMASLPVSTISAADVFAKALCTETIVLPFGGPSDFPEMNIDADIDDKSDESVKKRSLAAIRKLIHHGKGPSVIQLLHKLTDISSPEIKEGAIWCLNRLADLHPVTRAEVHKWRPPVEEAASIAATALTESARKALIRQKSDEAKARSLAMLAKSQSSFRAHLGDLDDTDDIDIDDDNLDEDPTAAKDDTTKSETAVSRATHQNGVDLLGSCHLRNKSFLTRAPHAPTCILCSTSDASKPSIYIALAEASRAIFHSSSRAAEQREFAPGVYLTRTEGVEGLDDPFERQAVSSISSTEGLLKLSEEREHNMRSSMPRCPTFITSGDIELSASGEQTFKTPLRLNVKPSIDRAQRDSHSPFSSDCGVNITTCGHVAHSDCIHEYLSKALRRGGALDLDRSEEMSHLRSRGRKPTNYQGDKALEFLCPLCRTLSNLLLPFGATAWPLHKPSFRRRKNMMTINLLQEKLSSKADFEFLMRLGLHACVEPLLQDKPLAAGGLLIGPSHPAVRDRPEPGGHVPTEAQAELSIHRLATLALSLGFVPLFDEFEKEECSLFEDGGNLFLRKVFPEASDLSNFPDIECDPQLANKSRADVWEPGIAHMAGRISKHAAAWLMRPGSVPEDDDVNELRSTPAERFFGLLSSVSTTLRLAEIDNAVMRKSTDNDETFEHNSSSSSSSSSFFQPTTNHYSIQRFRSAAAALIGSIRHADLLIHPLLSRQPRVTLKTREYLEESAKSSRASVIQDERSSKPLEFGEYAEPIVYENERPGQYLHTVVNGNSSISSSNLSSSIKKSDTAFIPPSNGGIPPPPPPPPPPPSRLPLETTSMSFHAQPISANNQVDNIDGEITDDEDDDNDDNDDDNDDDDDGDNDDNDDEEDEHFHEDDEDEEGDESELGFQDDQGAGISQIARDQGALLQQYTELLFQQTQLLGGDASVNISDRLSMINMLDPTRVFNPPKHFGYRHISCCATLNSKQTSHIPKILPSSFQAISCHPVRRTIALLLTQGSVNLAKDFQKDAFAHATSVQSDTHLQVLQHYDKFGTLVAAFLRQGTSATDEAPMVSSHISAPYGPFSAKRTPSTFFGDPRGAIRQEYQTVSLYEVNPCHLLLLSCSVAHAPEELLHYACLFLSVASVQCGIALFECVKDKNVDDIGNVTSASGSFVSPIGSILIPYIRFARLLLSLAIDPHVCGGIDALALAFDEYVTEVGDKFLIDLPLFVKIPSHDDMKLKLLNETSNNDALLLAVKTLNSAVYAFPQPLSGDQLHQVMNLTGKVLKLGSVLLAGKTSSSSSSSSSSPLPLVRSLPLPRIKLIDLPETFDSLYTSLMSFKCKHCNKRPDCLMLCLICGDLLCALGDCCRSCSQRGGSTSFFPTEDIVGGRRTGMGEATRHAILCGGGIGVQLMISSNQPYSTVVWLFRGEFCVNYSGIYLDAHGEEDAGFRRGRTLTLNMARYRALSLLYSRGLVGREVLSCRLRNSQRYIGAMRDSQM